MPLASDIVSLSEAREYLNIDSTTSDAELQEFISRASQQWVTRTGIELGPTTYDEWYDGGRSIIALRHRPVQSITSITEAITSSLAYTLNAEVLDGSVGGDAYGYTVDLAEGLLVRRVTGIETAFARGRRNVHVVYVAGYTSATLPADIKLAVLLLLAHMWETQRAPNRRRTQSDQPSATYAWPNRVQEIADAYVIPGIG